MSERNSENNKPAFSSNKSAGMSKLFYVACEAMKSGFELYFLNPNYSREDFIEECYHIADEMLKQERE